MSSIQTFLSRVTVTAANDLHAAYESLPADKREWSVQGKARTALDQYLECLILNGYMVDLVRERQWSDANFQNYGELKASLMPLPIDELKERLLASADKVVEIIHAVPDSDHEIMITMPRAVRPLVEVMSFPYWNMSYHIGQINYIASMLEPTE